MLTARHSIPLVAALLGMTVEPTMALPLSSYVAGSPDTLEVRVFSPHSRDLVLELALVRICNPASLNGASSANYAVYYCAVSYADMPPKLVVYRTLDGGESNAVRAMASATPLPFIDLPRLLSSPDCLKPETRINLAGFPDGYPVVYSMANIVCDEPPGIPSVPDIAIADVEPGLLGFNATTQANLMLSAGLQLTFGVPVTLALRDQLQKVQGKTAGSEAVVDIPSLSKAQLSAIYNGTIRDWADLGLPSGPVNIASRLAGDGITRVFNAYFSVSSICTPGGLPERAVTTGDIFGSCLNEGPPNASGNPTGLVMAGKDSGAVVDCLNNHYVGGRRAIGRLSLETAVLPFQGAGFRFIAIDGTLPTTLNVANGSYGLWAQSVYITRSPAAPGGQLSGPKLSLSDRLSSTLTSREFVRYVNSFAVGATHFALEGQVGYLARPVNLAAAVSLPAVWGGGGENDLSRNPTNAFVKGSITQPMNCMQGNRVR